MARRADGHPLRVSMKEYARGLAGGLLFSLPLLYTMETWETGSVISPRRLILGLACTFLLLLAYNRFAGLRHDASPIEVAIDSIEELGLGLCGAAAILWLLGRVSLDMSVAESMSRIVVQGMLGAIGVSIGTAQLGGEPRDQGIGRQVRGRDIVSHVALGACGAIILGANIAPTEEIQVLSRELSAWQLGGLAMVSYAIGAVVLRYSDFTGARPASESGAAAATRHAVATYAVALAASGVLLWFFGRFDAMPAGLVAAQVIVLGFPAALGASAGRLLLQS